MSNECLYCTCNYRIREYIDWRPSDTIYLFKFLNVAVSCKCRHPHSLTNAHNLYKITNYQYTWTLAHVAQVNRYVQGYIIQMLIKLLHIIYIKFLKIQGVCKLDELIFYPFVLMSLWRRWFIVETHKSSNVQIICDFI